MSGAKPRLLICSCEKSMSLDAQAIGRACAVHVTHGDQLCGLELARVNTALAEGDEITIACTQEAPLFKEVAEDLERPTPTFVNIRETAGWSKDAAAAGPKIAALIAAAREEMPPVALVTLESNGVVLIYGRDEVAIEAGERLADRLDITVLLTKPGDVTPRRVDRFPVLKGTVRNARGFLGKFELAIDDYAVPQPSSRAKLVFGAPRDGATSTCDLILDLSGGHRCFRRTTCVPAICAPIRPTAPRSSGRSRMPPIWSAPSTSRASSISKRRSARIRVRRSPAAPAASTCARPAPSRRTATASPSMRISARAAAPARRPAPPAPRPMRCRAPMR